MASNEPAPGGANANDNVGGGAGGKSSLGGGGEQPASSGAKLLGYIYQAPLDENGRLVEQSLRKGWGEQKMAVVIYGYDGETEGASLELHARVDEKLGQPSHKAYLYPVKDDEDAIPVFDLSGGGGGKAILGGAATEEPIYLAKLFEPAPAGGGTAQGSDSGAGGDKPADK
jgi:hypothetical protein